MLKRLKIGQKLALICVLLSLPIGVLAYVFYNAQGLVIDIANQEIAGVEYNNVVKKILIDSAQALTLSYAAASGDTSLQTFIIGKQAEVDKDFEALAIVDKKLGQALATTSQMNALKNSWQDVKSRSTGMKPAEVLDLYEKFIADTKDLSAHVADTSTLILDPDLDSYYMMDTIIAKAPTLIDSLNQAKAVGSAIVSRKTLTADEKLQLSLLFAAAKGARDALNRGIDVAYSNNPSGTVKAQIDATARDTYSSIDKFLELMDKKVINAAEITITPAEYAAVASKSFDDSSRIYDSAASTLVDLLNNRADKSWNIIKYTFAIGGFGLLLSGFLLFFVVRSITSSLKEAVAIAEKLAIGDLSASFETYSTDEIGQLLGAMNRMITYLKEMADAANSISQGNLDIDSQPRSSRDLFGYAFERMIKNLREMANVAKSISGGDLRVHVEPQSDQDSFGNAFKNMSDNLRKMAAIAEQISEGNLALELTPQSPQDAFGNIFKKMLEGLRTVVRDIMDGAQSLNAVANEMVATATQQTNTITDQASSIQQITTTLDEIRAIVEQANERAKAVVHVSEQSLDISINGQKELDQVVDVMSKIKYQVEAIAQNILSLSEKTIQIGEITSSVNEIAEQSNLLAVNAAIEATKAGEAGKGFGVVAVEVKNLAARSKKATMQVRSILAEIQKAANSTVMVTEEGSKRVESGVGQVYRIGSNIKSLHEVIVESSTAARQISSATNQQVTGIEQIAIAMRQINQGTNNTVAGAKQQRVTAQNLSQLASNLNSIVQRYRL
jgi:methyl-accepting chemotaxis protein